MTGLDAALVAGIVAGLGIAIPFGPIGILIVETALRRGFRAGWAAGAGAATADGLYALLAAFAGSAVATVIEPISVPLRLVSAAVLAGIAVRGLISLRSRLAGTPGQGALDPSLRRTYLTVVGLTIVNPLTIVYFSALVLGMPAIGAATGGRLAFFIGAFGASLTWQTLISAGGGLLHRRLPDRARVVTGLVGDLLILGLAVGVAKSVLLP